MAEVNRVIRDGKVAVLYSPGFGTGWSTCWRNEGKNIVEFMMFDADLVAAVEAGDRDLVDHLTRITIGRLNPEYFGRESDIYLTRNKLAIAWVPVGTLFRITEYDGNEAVITFEATDWFVA